MCLSPDQREGPQALALNRKALAFPCGRRTMACGVADAAVRKYLDQGHLYWPHEEASDDG